MFQAITPTPDIPCRPGWCLAYVNEAYGVPKRYGTATAAWLNSPTQHPDWNFPLGLWVPLWFSLATEPAGHVALLAPDGAVWSTSHPTSTRPTRHPDLADLFRAYSRYNPLTYLGWTEDVEGTRVLGNLMTESAIITPEEDMPSLDEIAAAVWSYRNKDIEQRDAYQILRDVPGDTVTRQVPYKDPVTGADTGQSTSLATMAGYADFQATATRALVLQGPAAVAQQLDAAGIAEEVRAELVKLLGGA